MADIINFGGKKNKNWLNQYAATSGQIPSAAVIDQMIQSELDAAYKNRYYSGALQLEQNKQEADKDYKNKTLEQTAARDAADAAYKQRSLDLQAARDAGTITSDQWRKEQGALAIQNAKETASADRSSKNWQAAAGLGTTALGLWGADKNVIDPKTGTATKQPGAISQGYSALKGLFSSPEKDSGADAIFDYSGRQESEWNQNMGANEEQMIQDTNDYRRTIEDYLSDSDIDYSSTVDDYLSGWSGADAGGY